MKKFAFNGLYHLGGQERMFKEILRELDILVLPNIIQVVIPHWEKFEEIYTNIEVVRYGNKNQFLWLQIDFPKYLKLNNRIGINMFNHCPIIKPDITTIHDLTMLFYKSKKQTFHSKLSNLYGRICRNAVMKRGKLILTVSETSKNDIISVYKIRESSVKVLGNSWQHMEHIRENMDIFQQYPQLKKGKYYFLLSSLAPNKNINWVKQVALRHKDDVFCIAGSMVGSTIKKDKSISQNNILYLGRISDSDMKALMKYCKAFIFPSFYEGFGIPPLEALSVGAPIIVSNTSCMPEIYGDSAHYINPYNAEVDLDKILVEKVCDYEEILQKYSWNNIAKKFYNILKNV